MMKRSFFVVVLLIPTMLHCQTDGTAKYIFGGQITIGGLQQDFSALYKYDYLLNRPQNFSFLYLSLSVFIGNPKKFFVSLFLGTSFGNEKRGTYNNYNIRAGGASSYMGAEIKFPLKTDFSKKVLQGIYISVGAQYMFTSIYSEARGTSPSMVDTTFYYERSRANNFLARIELMFEFFSLAKRGGDFRFPLTFKVGYNIQFSRPFWTGIYYRNPGDENPYINMGAVSILVSDLIFGLQKIFGKDYSNLSSTNKRLNDRRKKQGRMRRVWAHK